MVEEFCCKQDICELPETKSMVFFFSKIWRELLFILANSCRLYFRTQPRFVFIHDKFILKINMLT